MPVTRKYKVSVRRRITFLEEGFVVVTGSSEEDAKKKAGKRKEITVQSTAFLRGEVVPIAVEEAELTHQIDLEDYLSGHVAKVS